MGAWGVGPYDNDSARDWLEDASTVLLRIIRQGLWSRWDEMAVAAAQLLAELPASLTDNPQTEHVTAEALEVIKRAIQQAPEQGWKEGPEQRVERLQRLKSLLLALHAGEKARNQKRKHLRVRVRRMPERYHAKK